MRYQHHSNRLVRDFPEDSSQLKLWANEGMLREAFELLPDAVFLFAGGRRLIYINPAAALLSSEELSKGEACCEMFWHVEGAEGCVVDRAIQSGEKVEV